MIRSFLYAIRYTLYGIRDQLKNIKLLPKKTKLNKQNSEHWWNNEKIRKKFAYCFFGFFLFNKERQLQQLKMGISNMRGWLYWWCFVVVISFFSFICNMLIWILFIIVVIKMILLNDRHMAMNRATYSLRDRVCVRSVLCTFMVKVDDVFFVVLK